MLACWMGACFASLFRAPLVGLTYMDRYLPHAPSWAAMTRLLTAMCCACLQVGQRGGLAAAAVLAGGAAAAAAGSDATRWQRRRQAEAEHRRRGASAEVARRRGQPYYTGRWQAEQQAVK